MGDQAVSELRERLQRALLRGDTVKARALRAQLDAIVEKRETR